MPSSTAANIARMPVPTDDLRIRQLQTLSPPAQVIGEAPATSSIAEVVGDAAAPPIHADPARRRRPPGWW